MGCNLKDLTTPEEINLAELRGKRVGIDAFLTAFQFLTTIRDRSPTEQHPCFQWVSNLFSSSMDNLPN